MDVAAYLVSKHADVNQHNENDYTPAEIAVKARNVRLATFLFEKQSYLPKTEV